MGNTILLSGPLDVLRTLSVDIISVSFWQSIVSSLVRISLGFFSAFALGISLGAVAWHLKPFSTLFTPAVLFMKSVPVVCFIVLLLLWFGSSQASSIAVFLVAFPAFYFASHEGLNAKDTKMDQMLEVFRVSVFRRALAHYWPTMLPFLVATAKTSVGMSWKSGVAAELIALPLGSIGEQIYQAKITLSSADLFAWTFVIVIASLICERVFLMLLARTDTWFWSFALPRFNKTSALGGNGHPSPIHLNGVTKRFGENTVVNDLTRVIEAGARVAVKGPSGKGKTSLLSLIAGLEKPDSGSIDNTARVSMVFQETRLFETKSALDNIRLVAGETKSLGSLEAMMGEILPPQSLYQPVHQLSGGMKRRVEIVRAVATRSDTLVFDEPFSGLDPSMRDQCHRFILEHLEGRTLIIASHEPQDFDALGTQSTIEL